MIRWAILISGQGSNLQAVLDSWAGEAIQLVISNKKAVAGVSRATRAGVPFFVSQPLSWDEISNQLQRASVTHIFLLGFMRILPAVFVNQWQQRIYNLHPSLLPEFPGLHSIEKSFSAGGPMGVSVHEVVPEMDAGPLVYQKKSVESARDCRWNESEILTRFCEQRLTRKWIETKTTLGRFRWPELQ